MPVQDSSSSASHSPLSILEVRPSSSSDSIASLPANSGSNVTTADTAAEASARSEPQLVRDSLQKVSLSCIPEVRLSLLSSSHIAAFALSAPVALVARRNACIPMPQVCVHSTQQPAQPDQTGRRQQCDKDALAYPVGILRWARSSSKCMHVCC